MTDMKQIVKDLVERGKKNGVLTFDEINSAFDEIEITPEKQEKLYDILEKEDIEVAKNLEKSLKKLKLPKKNLRICLYLKG